ncbi:MAG: hypothetical protein IPK16_06320 [Anaerolineales bacterium]|nr:hypothetical protein [Anaerolineales bacterium]
MTAYHGADAAAPLRYESTRQVLSFELAQALALHLGLSRASCRLRLLQPGGALFHWLGDVYGCALVDLLRYTLRAEPGAAPGLCVQLLDEPRPLPKITASMVRHYLQDQFERYERLLPLGAYQDLLPRSLRRRAVVEQFDVERFVGRQGNYSW